MTPNETKLKQPHSIVLAVFVVLVSATCAADSPDDDVAGLWQGTLKYPGLELRVVFRITRTPDGTLAAGMLRPDEDDDETP